MTWHHLANNPLAITHLYDEVPPLEKMELIDLVLNRDGPKLKCKMDFPRFAEHRPERWSKDANTVHIELDFWEIQNLEISGFTTTPMLTFTLERSGDVIVVHAQDEGCRLRFDCKSIFIQRVSGYSKQA